MPKDSIFSRNNNFCAVKVIGLTDLLESLEDIREAGYFPQVHKSGEWKGEPIFYITGISLSAFGEGIKEAMSQNF